MPSSNCCFLTCIQISQEAGKKVFPSGIPIWYSHLLKNFPQFIVIHTVKGFDIVNKAEIDVFLELSCFFDDPADFGNLISDSSAFSKTSLNIWKLTVHVLLKPSFIPIPKKGNAKECSVASGVSNSLWPHWLQPTRLLRLWNFPGKNTGVGWLFLLQGIFLTQRLSPCLCLLHWQMGSLPRAPPRKPNHFSIYLKPSCYTP